MLLTVVGLATVLAVAGFLVFGHLNRNLTSIALPQAIQRPSASATPGVSPLAAGTPLNVLVVGSDTRSTSVDCKLGGDCSQANATGSGGAQLSTVGANADVEMLVHISADRSNMSVTSIPRDTMITVPSCTGNGITETPHVDRINSTLAYGLACTATAVHDLTNLPIDHVVMVDFGGVVQISDAIGGVSVCVNNNVYDPYSHLKLTKGTHTLVGLSALEFLRTRHGFGDGGDIGRTVAQHMFLAAVQRKVESAGTLLNPVTVYNLANTATSAVTVDTGLASVTDLARLAVTVAKIPTSRTTFLTMPTVPDPANPNVVLPGPGAAPLFTKIADDVSLTASTAPTAARTTAARTKASRTTSGRASGAAPTSRSTSASSHRATTTSTSPSPVAPSGSDFQQTASAGGCATVSQQATVSINGVPMTPIQAFANSPTVPLSAP
ncbi:MAG TPA: LCP family protein [Propionibacteriaceae bacterium]|nr:LCP family protein [Propionibacteriaceae bacterium]